LNFIDILISFVLALIMFGIGTTLKIRDFRRTFVIPRALILGLIFQIIWLPILAFWIAWGAPLSPELKVGLILIAICPGGSTSNFITYLVKADVPLSLSLTGINSFVILLTVPLLSNLAIDVFMVDPTRYHITLMSTFVQVFLVVFIPVILGIFFKYKYDATARAIRGPLKYINVALLALVFGIKFLAGEESGGSGITTAEFMALLPTTFLLHMGAMVVSFFVAIIVLNKSVQATTIGIEAGLQNTTLALLLAGTIIVNNEMTKPALVYATFSFFTTLIFAWLSARYGRLIGRLFRRSGSQSVS